ncbi:MAG: HNH endonuclease [Aeriscardovia sp.]|nr:HNH endonuclease [Aeriscardovia sp.]
MDFQSKNSNNHSRLARLSVEDSNWFSRESAMEKCFFPYRINPRQATANTGDECYAWFPKAQYKDKDGVIRAGAQDSNWKNYFEDNGRRIISWLNDGEFPTDAKKEPEIQRHPNPLYCFWCYDNKETGEKYKYVGTYLEDTNSTEPRRRLYRQLRTDIDLSGWYSHGGDFDWRDTDKDGLDSFRRLYIKSYRKQKDLLDSFRKEELPAIKGEEEALTKIVADVNGKSIADFDAYLSFVSSKLKEFCGVNISSNQILNIGDWNSVGLAFVDISQTTNNSHNRIIRGSVLGQELASKVLALYDMKFFLYSLSENETEFYLKKLNMSYEADADITEKHSLLYFWKQCNVATMEDLTPYEYYRFLKYVFDKADVDFGQDSVTLPEEEQTPSKTYLITWNPNKWDRWPGGYTSIVNKVNSGECYTISWTFSNSRVKPGDVCYLMRLGTEPRGIIAKGTIRSRIYKAPRLELDRAAKGETADHVDVEFSEMINYQTDDFIHWNDLTDLFPEQTWTPQSSGIAIVDEYVSDLDELWSLTYSSIKKNEKKEDIPSKRSTKQIISITEQQVTESEDLEYKSRIEVEKLVSEDADQEEFTYFPKPEVRAVVEKSATSGYKGAYPRDPQRKFNAMRRSGCTCELCPQHISFISKRTGKRYVETHHIIPLEFWESFENSLDVEANIATLCSNCHNEIHYGVDAIELIERLYEMRFEELEAAGIGISKEQLIAMYEGKFISIKP